MTVLHLPLYQCQQQQKWFDYLHTIKQKKGESICAFVNCFNMITLEVRDLDQLTTMVMIMDGLLKNNLKKLLIKTYLQNFLDMLAHAKKYAHTEEAFAEETPISSVAIGQNKECSPRGEERNPQHSQSPSQRWNNEGRKH